MLKDRGSIRSTAVHYLPKYWYCMEKQWRLKRRKHSLNTQGNRVQTNTNGQTRTNQNADEDASNRTIKENVKVAEENTQYQQSYIKMLETFEIMLDVQSRRINVVRLGTDLKASSQRPIYSTPFRAWLKAREFEKQKVEWMVAEIVIELAQMERAAPVVFGSKKRWISPLMSLLSKVECSDCKGLVAFTLRGQLLRLFKER